MFLEPSFLQEDMATALGVLRYNILSVVELSDINMHDQ